MLTRPPVTLDVETACGICNEASGALGDAIMRTLKEAGVKIPTKAARKAFFSESWHECETGTLQYPDPKKRGRMLTAAWLRAKSLLIVLQTMARRQAKGGTLAWDANVPADEYWFQLVIDKGGTTTKVLLKFICVEFSDSVGHSTIVGLLDKVKDTYEFEVPAFGPLFNQLNYINRNWICIYSEWHQRIPRGFHLRPSDARPERTGPVSRLVSAAIAKVVAASRGPPPSPVAAVVAAAITNVLARCAAAHAAHARSLATSSAAAAECRERRPDCKGCARWKGGCPTAARLAFARNGSGPFPPKPREPPPQPRQVGCTFCSDCAKCLEGGDQLEVLREQWRRCTQRGEAPRRLRGMVGGDWMSQTTPLGIGGPTSTCFCPFCLGTLNGTCVAGVPHLPAVEGDPRPPHLARPALRAGTQSIARQAAAFAAATAAADADADAGRRSKQPAAADFDNCLHPPLLWAWHLPDFLSSTPLHYLLGIGLLLVNLLEGEVKAEDRKANRWFGTTVTDAASLERIAVMRAEVKEAGASLAKWSDEVGNHSAAMEAIAADPSNAEAIRLAAKKLAGGREPSAVEEKYRAHTTGLKAAQTQLKKAEKLVDKVEAENNALWDDVQIGLRMTKFLDAMESCNLERQAYFKGAMNGNDLKRLLEPEAIKMLTDLLRPADAVYSHLSLVSDAGVVDDPSHPFPGGEVTPPPPHVSLALLVTGSSKRADDFHQLLTTFADCVSLFGRKTALCDHLIDRFKQQMQTFAHLLAEMFPTLRPIPKLHGMCYHMVDQMRRLGGTGILHEGVVEAAHVVDNALIRRFCCVRDLEQQLVCRARAAWQHSDPSGAKDIRAPDKARDARKRDTRTIGRRVKRAK